MGTEGDAVSGVFGFTRDAEPAPRGSRGGNQRRGPEYLAAAHAQYVLLFSGFEGLDRAVFAQFDAVGFHVAAQVAGQFGPRGPGYGDEVLDTDRFVHLPADAPGHHSHLQPLAGRVDRRCSTCRSASGHYDVVAVFDCCALGGAAPDTLLELLEQFAQRAPTRVEWFAVAEDARYGLDPQPLGLLGKEGAVDGRMADLRVENRQHVEGLHHVGAVRTGQRHVGLQFDRPFECLDPAAGRLVGKVAPLSVGIEHGQYQRAEFMPVGHGPEADAELLSVLQDPELESGALAYAAGEAVGCGGRVAEQFEQLRAGPVARADCDVEEVVGLQRPEQFLELLLERCVQHSFRSLRSCLPDRCSA
ncbi:unknown [Alistipes sp. CAG:268]|nr:unknown [Alistipes sp. CAG:268]